MILLNSQNMLKKNIITLKVTDQSVLLGLVATELVNVLSSPLPGLSPVQYSTFSAQKINGTLGALVCAQMTWQD